MSLTIYEKSKLEQLKQIKTLRSKHVEFWVTGYTDSLFTKFEDPNSWTDDELTNLLVDTAIKYLENKQKEK